MPRFFFKVSKARTFNRRRFLRVGGTAVAGVSAATVVSQSFTTKFLSERLGDMVKPSMGAGTKPNPQKWSENGVTASLLGHSTVLINFYGMNILTDPVLFSRIGADLGLLTVGPLRREASALKANELPKLDLVLLSHAHLDHFDIPSLRALNPDAKVVTATGTTDLFMDTSLRDITELKWGQKEKITTAKGSVEVEAFPVRHWGARWRHDTHRGYNGYVLRRGGKQIIFGGDTAHCEEFKKLKNPRGYDLACMPIGAYNPWVNSHCNPEEAISMANDAGAKHILPMHFYTFRLGREHCMEPIERFQEGLSAEKGRIALKAAGETFVLPA